MKKSRVMLGFLGLASAAFSLAAISCGSSEEPKPKPDPNVPKGVAKLANDKFASKRFDQENDGKIVFGSTWSSRDVQWKAFEAVIKVYNEQMKNEKGFMPVELKSIAGGYSGGTTDVQSKLSGKDAKAFYNLTANYAPVLSMLAGEGMLLNFDDDDETVAVKKDVFSDSVMVLNSNTTNIVNDGMWMVPAFKSTTVMSVNAPVMSYIIEGLVSKGAKIDPAFTEYYNNLKTQGAADRAEVAKLWGAVKSSIVADAYKDLIIGFDTFRIYNQLVEFAKVAQDTFEESSKGVNSQVHFLGLDDAIGFLETIAFASVNANPDESFTRMITKDSNRQVDFSPFASTEATVYKNFASMFDKLKPIMGNGAVVINGKGVYTSNTFIEHKFALWVGSTAGYKYNRVDASDVYKYGTNEYELERIEKVSVRKKDNLIGIGKYSNPVKKFDIDNSSIKKYDYITKDETTWNNFESNKAAITSNSKISLVDAGQAAGLDAEINGDANIVKLGEIIAAIGDGKKEGDSKIAYLIKDITDSKIKKLAKSQSTKRVNDNELFILPTTSKLTSQDEKDVFYGQGPSIMGIHANDAEDYATKMFMKWLVTDKKYDIGSKTQVVPTQYISEEASYIFAKKGFENNDLSKANIFLKHAYDVYTKVSKEPEKYVLFEELGDAQGSKFRDSFNAAYATVSTHYANGEAAKVTTYEEMIVKKVKESNGTLFS
ncbi:Uncharacterized lipoprotein MPN_097 precursor [Mycoplasmopsis californica]|uniref:P80 family lipoprotein n=1 Tax=Mycoplasmopsis equigenitalium TaxID=114883 RepID=A0ABY5J2V7_9BACT|nr:P80 family lipoprotein [Mycoplasmopsis equigenitalium]UUD36866.1 P80 family lipoprotein [Mycoplasmopsis equigenitalium]VEU69839.1 Uncharacterized lipoprotein MPN_097 precursor [Mycoplasmopsis californica]